MAIPKTNRGVKSVAKAGSQGSAPDWPKVGLVVGIGASAGGLAAFRTFLTHMPPDTGMAFILVQHLDPNHPSMLVDLLTPHTAMPVTQAQDGAKNADHDIADQPKSVTLYQYASQPPGYSADDDPGQNRFGSKHVWPP
jgi:Chemotaxis response regulator containing a CheY-like receiver domain and a methylesterase domain